MLGVKFKDVVIGGLFVFSTLFSTSCVSEARTRLFVVFISDLEINQIEVEIQNLLTGAESAQSITPSGTPLFQFPGSVVIEAAENGKDAEFIVLFTATGPDQAVTLTQRVRTNFVPYETRRLPVYFHPACLGVTCSEKEQCNEDGQCESYWRKANTLEEVTEDTQFDDL